MINVNELDFEKVNGLMPAIIQDAETMQVLMLGYMNEEALIKTLAEKRITFFSRTKNRLWTKGEESGHYLELQSVKLDCDQDSLLFQVLPNGPTCHTGTKTCWQEEDSAIYGILKDLESTIDERWVNEDTDSYIASLKKSGTHKIAQKVGEEAVETVIEALRNDDHLFLEESADLLFHYLVLLKAKGFELNNVLEVLKKRKK